MSCGTVLEMEEIKQVPGQIKAFELQPVMFLQTWQQTFFQCFVWQSFPPHARVRVLVISPLNSIVQVSELNILSLTFLPTI